MTKKHFEAIARVILAQRNAEREAGNIGGEYAVARTAMALADEFENLNERFDRKRFMTACGF